MATKRIAPTTRRPTDVDTHLQNALAHEHLTYEDLLQIVELVKSSEQFSEFRLKIGEIEIELRRRGSASATRPTSVAPDVARSKIDDGGDARRSAPTDNATHGVARDAGARTAAGTSSTDANVQSSTPAVAQDWPPDSVVVRAPMVGTFYRSPAPGAPPFVTVGQAIEANTTVCIIEVMKLMNSIPAGASGVVTHILVEDAQSVDAGAPLIVVDPRDAPP